MDRETVAIEPLTGQDGACQVVYGEEYERLERRYGDDGHGLDEQGRSRVFDTATRILGQCPDPYSSARRRTGLAIGKVQSGKTMSYIALSALACDSGYKVIVVLAGRTKPLAEQNRRRFEEDLVGGRSAHSLATFHNPSAHNGAEIQTILEDDRPVLITLLKQQNRIATVRDILSSGEIGRYPTLIIDDEADQASHNTSNQQGNRSIINTRILELRDTLPLHAYVAYTATPQANLLIGTWEALSPDFCVLVEPGSGYTGGSTFFGPNRGQYINIVPDEEAEDDDFVGVPEHLRLALATFLVSGAIIHLRQQDAFHSMLIHNSTRKADHQSLHRSVQDLVDGWKEALRLPDADPGAQEVLDLARVAYDDLLSTARECPTWDEVSSQLRRESRSLKIWLVNSLPQGTNPSSSPFNLPNNIMIGGNMLDRGVTIPGLAITYITRRARTSQADTVEQRARWFGYKESYLDVCRIFTSRALAETYTDLLSHEDDFWERLERNEIQGIPISEWARMFRLDTLGMRPTRSSVAQTRRFRSNDWIVQGRPAFDHQTSAANVRAVHNFFAERPDATSITYGSETGVHLAIRDCDPNDVIELLLNTEHPEETDWDSGYVVEYLQRLIIGCDLSGVDVLLMSEGEVRNRTPSATGRINPMEGPRRNYPGDYYINEGRVQLQAHIVRVQEREDAPERTILLAFHVPDRPEYDLGHLVVRSG